MGSPFAPNEVPAPVCAAALTESRYHVRSAHAVVKVQLSRKEKYRHAVQAKNFVGVKRRQNDRVCCGAVNSSWTFPHGSGGSHGDNQPLSVAVFKMNTTTSCGWF